MLLTCILWCCQRYLLWCNVNGNHWHCYTSDDVCHKIVWANVCHRFSNLRAVTSVIYCLARLGIGAYHIPLVCRSCHLVYLWMSNFRLVFKVKWLSWPMVVLLKLHWNGRNSRLSSQSTRVRVVWVDRREPPPIETDFLCKIRARLSHLSFATCETSANNKLMCYNTSNM